MSNANLIEQRAADWLARRDAGGWSAQQQSELDAWLAAATAHQIAFLRLESVWSRADRLVESRAAVTPAAPASAPLRFAGWRWAACLALASALALMSLSRSQTDPGQAYATAIGESRIVALSEGSRITLNTATRLRASVADDARTVWLDSGEAFFDVAHDSARPFVINAGASRIAVLGTRFSVRRDGSKINVLVAEGRVRVRQSGKEFNLAANGAAALSTDRIVLSRQSPAEVSNRLSWREGRLVLDQMSLQQAADEFNRYNARKLVISDPALFSMAIGGSFAPTNVDGFARLLQEGFGLRVEPSGDKIKISR